MARWDTAGTIGHVAHGKLTVVKVISGVMTVRFKNDLLGYANAKGCYRSYHSNKEDHPPYVSSSTDPNTIFSWPPYMTAALLLIAGNGLCPQPQISEHPTAVEIIKLQNIIILCRPIVPISTQLKYSIDAANEYIVKRILIPVWDFMLSRWSNIPGAEVNELKNGVTGGLILAGVLTLGMHVEICPDIATKAAQGHNRCHPIFSCIVTLLAENNQLQFTVSGGLIGVGTMIDPTLCRADWLCAYALPSARTELEVSLFRLRCLLDTQTEDKKTAKVTKFVKNELLLINISSTSTGGCVLSVKVNLKALEHPPPPAPRHPALRWRCPHIGCSLYSICITAS
ncbi:translation initiation factor eIF2 gamma subunit [Phellopilus nigrolimitatus]|nr:translation initiation factor eIF2 gamma subunit [Phellopilus nigrolimitatus]